MGIAKKFQEANAQYLKSLDLTAKFVVSEDYSVEDHSLVFVNSKGQQSIVYVQLHSANTLNGARVSFEHIEKTKLENGWEHHQVVAVEEVTSEKTATANILKALRDHGHEFDLTENPPEKVLTHPLFIEAYKRAKAVLPDATFVPLRTTNNRDGFTVQLKDGTTVLVDVENGQFNVTKDAEVTSFSNYGRDGGAADKLASYFEQLAHAAPLYENKTALDAEVEKWVPSEDCKWSVSKTIGTTIEKYALSVDPDDGQVTVVRAWKNLEGDPMVSVDLQMGFNDFAGEINDDKFTSRQISPKMENAVRTYLKGQAVEFVWATDFLDDGAFVARSVTINRAEHVVAGTIEFDGGKAKVVIGLDQPTDTLRPEHVAKPRM